MARIYTLESHHLHNRCARVVAVVALLEPFHYIVPTRRHDSSLKVALVDVSFEDAGAQHTVVKLSGSGVEHTSGLMVSELDERC